MLVIPQDGLPGASSALLSLVFAPGRRPRADDIAALAVREPAFSISHRPAIDEGWLELLVNGLTFDLLGLAPGPPAPPPPVVHRFGQGAEAGHQGEAIALAPGPHLVAGRNLPPVIRGAVSIGAVLARLTGVTCVAWHPARSAVAPEPFSRSVSQWLDGGAFPALGLTAIYAKSDGRMCSEGLSLFIGQELCLEKIQASASAAAKLALRLIDRLVAHGRLTAPLSWGLDDHSEVRLEPEVQGSTIRAWVRKG